MFQASSLRSACQHGQWPEILGAEPQKYLEGQRLKTIGLQESVNHTKTVRSCGRAHIEMACGGMKNTLRFSQVQPYHWAKWDGHFWQEDLLFWHPFVPYHSLKVVVQPHWGMYSTVCVSVTPSCSKQRAFYLSIHLFLLIYLIAVLLAVTCVMLCSRLSLLLWRHHKGKPEEPLAPAELLWTCLLPRWNSCREWEKENQAVKEFHW